MMKFVEIAEATAITHGGLFHADEVMATVILEKVFGEISLNRAFRVPEYVDSNVIVYDIGFGEFDHHQQGGNGCRENGVPYAAAGLIWKEFGHAVVAQTPDPEYIWEFIDKNLIQGIDAVDCGVMPKADYPVSIYGISSVISGFNPTWDSDEKPDDAFMKAVEFARVIFDNLFNGVVSTTKAKNIVEEAIEQAEEGIMNLEEYTPWESHIFGSENPKAEEILYVVFPSIRGGYMWQCVPDAPGSFGQRKPVPAEWKGLRDEAIQEATGVATAIFCHPAGFCGGAARPDAPRYHRCHPDHRSAAYRQRPDPV